MAEHQSRPLGRTIATRWAGVRTLLFQSRAEQPLKTLHPEPEADGVAASSSSGVSEVPALGLCRVRGHLAGRADTQGVFSLEFLPAVSERALHTWDIALARPGPFEATIYVPLWCRRLRWSWKEQMLPPAGGRGDAAHATPSAAQARLASVEYRGPSATLRFLLSDYLHLRPLLHWAAWFCTERLRRWLRPGARAYVAQRAYAELLAQVEPELSQVAPAIDAHVLRMAEHPDFTVLVDAQDCDPTAVQDTVDSLTAQLWPHWRLEILNADPARSPLVQGARQRLHAPGNCTLAQRIGAVARGYLIVLRAGDRLSALALYYLAAEHQRRTDALLLYADDDRLDAEGRRVEPHLHGQWNPEWQESHDGLGVLVALRAQAVRDCGGWREEAFGAAARYELLLRLTRGQPAGRMRHVPVIGVSRPLASREPEPAFDAMRRALQEHVAAVAPGALIEVGRKPGWLRLRRALPEPAPRVSIIVPTRDGDAHLKVCVDSLLALTDYPDYELILVDNQSRHAGTLAYLRAQARDPRVRLLPYDAPFNFSAICNRAVQAASGQVVLLLNDDTQVLSPGWLREMVSLAVLPDVGAVGAKLYFPDGTIQHGGVALGIGGVAAHLHWGAQGDDDGYLGRLKAVQVIGAVTGACLAVMRERYLAVGGMDEAQLRVALNDIDLCLKLAEHGWRSVWTPYAELVHHESKSRGRDTTPQKRALFAFEHAVMRRRWLHRLNADPYYHPWLTRRHLDLRLEDQVPMTYCPWWESVPLPSAEAAQRAAGAGA